ncbi:MAG TPA: hypothetical protein VEA16_03325 [Vicinamibacterales bacterium]|nr:hypothetical protein [Vicinamibacterales bacterium]
MPIAGHPRELTIAAPQNIPPWVVEDLERGITLDILNEALTPFGYRLKFRYVSLSRLGVMMADEAVDGVAMVEAQKIVGPYHYSDATAYFETSLISLRKHRFVVDRLEDLLDKRVVAFQDASLVFPDVAWLKGHGRYYSEVVRQAGQVSMLYWGRADFLLIDRNIFLYWKNQIDARNPDPITLGPLRTDVTEPVVFHDLSRFTRIAARAPMQNLFRSAQVRDHFNQGLRALRESGRYQAIIDEYTVLDRDALGAVRNAQ